MNLGKEPVGLMIRIQRNWLALAVVMLLMTRAAHSAESASLHWAFQPVHAQQPPSVNEAAWAKSDIDRFILSKLESKGLRPSPAADRRTLIRRATFDLTGLPPTPSEIGAFVADASPDAFAKVVDRLLASRAYGEKWGRHWLDVARYADTAGDGSDYPIREAYKYRNWVIDAFNADMPFDQFVREQIAGDILAKDAPPDVARSRIIATGYLAVTKRFGYNVTSSEFQHLDIADTIDVMGRSILGLSIGCARCHDHKYDPVSMADYYGLYGIFNSTRYSFPGGEETNHPAYLVPVGVSPDVVDEYQQELDATEAKIKELTASVTKQPAVQKDLTEAQNRYNALLLHPPFEVAYAVTEEEKPADVKIQLRGEPGNNGPDAPRRFLSILGGDTLPASEKGSGRRELAEWLTRPSNPLTARVIVNRVWQWHFGHGIVRSSSDFGTRGDPPTHPELLDYLASRFVSEGWSIKRLHRLIMLSSAYQMSSDAGDNATLYTSIDPDDRLLWKFPRRRLEAEEVRDTMLAVAGTLDPTPGEQHPFPAVESWHFSIHSPFYAAYPSSRRSVYLMVQRQKRHPYLSLFDSPDPNISSEERPESITPKQALYLMNSPFVHEQSMALADRLTRMSAPDDAARVRSAWGMLSGKQPREEQVADAVAFLGRYSAAIGAMDMPIESSRRAAWAAYARVLMTSNEYLYVD